MPWRRNDYRREELFGERAQRRGYYPDPSAARGDDERYRPRRWERSLGWARQRDVDDSANQQAAPRAGGRYDRSGEDRYARGLEEFEEYEAGGARAAREPVPSWGLGYAGAGAEYPMERRNGPHRGRGPRGYQRSDERIREDVCDALTEAGDVDASAIEVAVISAAVTLSGTIANRYEKRRAEDLAEAVSGVREVQNHLRLQPTTESDAERWNR